MNDKKIDVISLGTDLQVPPSAADALQSARLIIGAQRHLDALDCRHAATAVYPSPIDALSGLIKEAPARHIAVLASGDALFFGIGSWLLRHCAAATLRFHPNVTSVQVACARLGRPWQTLRYVSLHGRPLMRLRAVLAAGQSLAIFTDTHNSPVVIARELVACGFADSRVHLFESLGSDTERVRTFSADRLATYEGDTPSLNLLLIDVCGSGGLLPAFPGIPDGVFAAGGDTLFTKCEVRLAALARLALCAGENAWDIGAGSGGIAIEWARWAPDARVYAIERDVERRRIFSANLARFGDHGNLELVAGEAPSALADLPCPDAIYLGGSGGHLSDTLDICWQRLRGGGRLVAAGVTLETRTALQHRQWPVPVDFSDITVSRSTPLGSQTAMRAHLPVLLATVVKPKGVIGVSAAPEPR